MFYTTIPSKPLFGLRREIDRLFDDTFAGAGQIQTGWIPVTDVRETDAALTLEMELPGISPDMVEVTAENGVLTIKGRREATSGNENEKSRWLVTERVHGAFQRSFKLPESVEGGAIEAAYAHGLLTVRLPKAAKPEPRKIQVKTS
jgi:HSP20 family protein